MEALGAYLFVHFKEMEEPEGEQVYFGLSRDGFSWEEVNGGQPVLVSTLGDRGVRDFTIVRTHFGKFFILATDLSLANCLKGKYQGSWENIGKHGSDQLMLWESPDLVHWSGQRTVSLAGNGFGCCWAPDVIYDRAQGDYVLHWSSSQRDDGWKKSIYYCRTKDFVHFSKPQLMLRKEDSDIIDSNIVEHRGWYYRFVKSGANPEAIVMGKSRELLGEYQRLEAFDRLMEQQHTPRLEAPTCYPLPDGRMCLMLDFFGCPRNQMRYLPFVEVDGEKGEFVRADGRETYPFLPKEESYSQAPEEFQPAKFRFPYGFKHGTVLPITLEEYQRIRDYQWDLAE